MAKSKGFGKNTKDKNPAKGDRSQQATDQKRPFKTTSEALTQAFQHFQTGQFVEAEQQYRQILQQQPDQPDALHWLGVIACQSSREEEGFRCLQQAAALAPEDVNIHNSLGVASIRQGNLEQAVIHLKKAIALRPDHFIAHTNLGGLLRQNRLQDAVVHLQTALELNPDYAPAHQNLGLAFMQQGSLSEAVACLERAIAIAPDQAGAYHDLGTVLLEQGEWEAAVSRYQQAIALWKHAPSELHSTDTAHTNLGNALFKLGQVDEAILNLQTALNSNPDNAIAHDVMGVLLMEQGNLEQAIAHLRRSISLDPENADTHYNLALALLAKGDLHNGFAEHEWRWQTKKWVPALFPQPLWDGSDLMGKTIMLHAEQGFGDTIQFIRYVSLVKAQGGRIVAACQPPLKSLLATIPEIEQLIVPDEDLPEFQVQAPLMSLPWLFKTTLETIPAQPYLAAPTDDRLKLELLPKTRLKVGVVWASGRRESDRRSLRFYEQKSCPFTTYSRLFSIPEVSFYSLQVGDQVTDIAQLEDKSLLQDLSPQIQDFADTAVLIAQMDLVISVDTAVAHLAGALGKPVWLLLPFAADWRWMRERQDSPWYPTMRLFRQSQPGDWEGVIDRVAATLRDVMDGELEPIFTLEPDRLESDQLNITSLQTTVLEQDGTNFDHNNLGLALVEAGKLEEAATHFRQAIALNPNNALAHVNLGNVLRERGALEEAGFTFQTALDLNSDEHTRAYAHNSFGTVLLDQGNLNAAAFHFRQAIALRPQNFLPYINLGTVLHLKDNLEESIHCFQIALSLNSNYASTYFGLGLVLKQQGKWQEAAVCLRQAIALDPNQANAHVELGDLLREQGQLDQAISSLQTAITLDPVNASAHDRLGVVLQAQGRLTEALIHLHRAVELDPKNSSSLNSLAIALLEQGHLTEAAAYLRQAIALDPDNASTHSNLAQVLLSMGDLQTGFAEHEWRWRMSWAPTSFPQPLWDGSALNGQTILLHSEQGLGDTIQFVRYVHLVKELEGEIVVACQAPLKRLLATVPNIKQLVVLGETLPEFQVHAPLMSLPHILRTTLETIPAAIPYLTPPAATDKLNLRSDAKLKVGLVWAGGHLRENLASFNIYQRKSCPLSKYTQLLSIPDISFYSLQIGRDAADIAELEEGYQLQDLSPNIVDFADTAALIAQMDLVISVDTAVAHLAGALGKPVWVLLPFAADWRWMQGRDDSPWYPTMRLFRQTKPGDWEGASDRMANTLQQKLNQLDSRSDLPATETEILQQAVNLTPNNADIHNRLGVLLMEQGDLEQAEIHLQQAVSLRKAANALTSADALTYNSLGAVLQMQSKLEAAMVAYQKAISLDANHVAAYTNLGNVLRESGLLSEALLNLQKALALKPNDADVHNTLGAVLMEQDRLEEAVTHLQQAISLEPSHAEAFCNLGLTRVKQDEPEQAIIDYRRAIQLNPRFAVAHRNLSHALLIAGDLGNGFAEYEWRWLANRSPLPAFHQPRWDGSDLDGKTILLDAEQGFGDIIQFIRYAALVRDRGGRIIVTCPNPLKRLLSTVEWIEQVIGEGEPLPDFQVYVPLMSLPYILGTDLATIPSQVPYLTASVPHHLKLEPFPNTQLKVGLVWASGYKNQRYDLFKNYQHRSCPLSAYTRLLSIPNISFYSLQVGHHASDIAQLQDEYQLQDLSSHIHDFADTAALITQMDLVISVDTAVAHLAGALGKPIWTLLSFAPDWRWLQKRQDGPWYPTMRLFRQSSPGDWEGVLTQVSEALSKVTNGVIEPVFRLESAKSDTTSLCDPPLIQHSIEQDKFNIDNIIGIKCIAPIFDASGYGEWSRSYIVPLIQSGVPITLETPSFEKSRPDPGKVYDFLVPYLNKKIDYNAVIAWLTPEMAAHFFESEPDGILKINFTLWETTKLPQLWVSLLNSKSNECWLPGAWNAEIFKDSGVTIPLKTFRHPIDAKDYDLSEVNPAPGSQASRNNTYTFYFISQWTERKNFVDLLEAYWAEFQQGERVSLVLKTYSSNHDQAEEKALLEHIKQLQGRGIYNKLPNIHLVTQLLSRTQMLELHQRCDCYVSPSRGEGLGLGILDAGLFGKPIITNLFGEQASYLDEETAYIYDYSLRSVLNMNHWYTADQRWAQPDIDGMAKQMRFCFENQQAAREKGERLKQSLINLCDPKQISREILLELSSSISTFQANRKKFHEAHQTISTVSELPSADALSQAWQHFQTGQFAEAEQLYRQILQQQPEQPDALHWLGVIVYQSGRPKEAFAHWQQAIALNLALNTNDANLHNSLGAALMEQGDLEQATAHLQWAIALNPNHFFAHSNLANVLISQGNLEEAITHLQQVAVLNPNDADAHNSLGTILHQQGKLEEAAAHYRQAISLQANNVIALTNLGNLLRSQGNLDEALRNLRSAFSFDSNYAPTHNGLGVAYLEQGNLVMAVAHLQQAIALQELSGHASAPDDADAHYNLGLALKAQGKLEEAAASYRKAIAFNPSHVLALVSLGDLLREQDQCDEAILHLQKALTLSPEDPAVYTSLGLTLHEQGRWEAAATYLHYVVQLHPQDAQAHSNLAAVLWTWGQVDEAIARYQTAIELEPNYVDAHLCLAQALLLRGDFEQGLAEYEWRRRSQVWSPRSFPQPLWDGSNLDGKTILLHPEQGFGDTLQFIRYAPLVCDRGGRVVFECPAPLMRLFAAIPNIEWVSAETVPEFQVHAPLLSLLHILGTTLETIPAQIPYLIPPIEPSLKLELLPSNGLKVGLVWASGYREGQDVFKIYKQKSCDLALFSQLLSVPGISFYSLQVGHNAGDIAQLSDEYQLQDLSPYIHDFADTAALVEQLDLVISVDTAVAHLAGALGKPVWVLLSRPHDWRWLLDRGDTPWYPTMRLFRQPVSGDWVGVLDQVAEALDRWTTESRCK